MRTELIITIGIVLLTLCIGVTLALASNSPAPTSLAFLLC